LKKHDIKSQSEIASLKQEGFWDKLEVRVGVIKVLKLGMYCQPDRNMNLYLTNYGQKKGP
jgi:hypothetical protein